MTRSRCDFNVEIQPKVSAKLIASKWQHKIAVVSFRKFDQTELKSVLNGDVTSVDSTSLEGS